MRWFLLLPPSLLLLLLLPASLPCTDAAAQDSSGIVDIEMVAAAITEGRPFPSQPAEPKLPPENSTTGSPINDDGDVVPETDKFWPSLMSALVLILASEIGDKTFLISAILAMRNSRILIFAAGLSALMLMTIISAACGLLLPNLIPRRYTLWMVAVLFAVFGVKMLIEGSQMSSTRMREEYDEVNHEIEDREDVTRRRTALDDGGSSFRWTPLGSETAVAAREEEWDNMDCQTRLAYYINRAVAGLHALRLGRLLSPVFVQTFSLTFLAEWGDRSQIATIALAAAQNVYGVTIGAILGHAICTAMAVISGRLLATVLSIKTVTIVGGLLFIMFAGLAAL